MKRQEKTKIIKKFAKRNELIKYACECASDSEGFQLTVSQRNSDTYHSRLPDLVERLIQNLARKESEEKNKSSKKVERKRPVKNQKNTEAQQIPKESMPTKSQQETPNVQKIKTEEKSSKNLFTLNKSKDTAFQNHQNKNSSIPNPFSIQIEDTLPKVFSQVLKDDSIVISPDGKSASIKPQSIEGKVLIDFAIKNKVSWQLRLSKQTEQATFGICQIHTNQINGEQTIINIDAIDKNQERNSFSYSNGQTVQLTFDPLTQNLGFFNAARTVATKFRASPKRPGFEYYPYVFLKKGTVFLEMNWLINQLKKQQNA